MEIEFLSEYRISSNIEDMDRLLGCVIYLLMSHFGFPCFYTIEFTQHVEGCFRLNLSNLKEYRQKFSLNQISESRRETVDRD